MQLQHQLKSDRSHSNENRHDSPLSQPYLWLPRYLNQLFDHCNSVLRSKSTIIYGKYYHLIKRNDRREMPFLPSPSKLASEMRNWAVITHSTGKTLPRVTCSKESALSSSAFPEHSPPLALPPTYLATRSTTKPSRPVALTMCTAFLSMTPS